jgi:D-alanyl-lipoteichoic acid acyltransferase DltB (MBOAT superfamily)
MDFALLGHWEWLILELLLLGFLVYELISVNRLIKRDRAGKPKTDDAPPSD